MKTGIITAEHRKRSNRRRDEYLK